MKNAIRTFVEVTTMPLVWALAFIITVTEIPAAFLSTSAVGAVASAIGLPAEMVPELCSAVVFCAVLLNPPRFASLVQRGWLFVVAPALGILGLLICCVPGQESLHPLAVMGGVFSLQVALSLLLLIGLELLSGLSSLEVRRVVVGSSIVNAIAMGAAGAAPLLFAFGSLILGSSILAVARKTTPALREGELKSLQERHVEFPYVLAVGLIVVVASFGFLQELLYQQDALAVSWVIFGTKLAAVAVFVGVLTLMGDTNYSTLARLIVTLAVAAFLVFLAQGSYSLLPSIVMNIGYSLLEMTTLVIAAELAATARLRPLCLFAAIYLVESIGYIVGCVMAQLSFGAAGLGLRSGAVLLALALVVCAVWVFTEKRVNEFLWGASNGISDVDVQFLDAGEGALADGGSGCDGQEGFSPAKGEGLYGRKVAALAESYRLSPREVEVLELFAAGRSAAFIAELQFVTINTVRSHIKHIYSKCDVHSRQELITLIEHQMA